MKLERLIAVGLLGVSPIPLRADAPPETSALAWIREARAELGLDDLHDFEVRDAFQDGLGQHHVRVQQTYRGVPVWGGQAILHEGPGGGPPSLTNALVGRLQVETRPNLTSSEALAVAQSRQCAQGAYLDDPETELVVWPGRNQAPRLAYHIHLGLENGARETDHRDYLVDAHTGTLIRSWSTLFTIKRRQRRTGPPVGEAVPGTGHSQFSGQVALSILKRGDHYELCDPSRGGFAVRNLAGGTRGPGRPIRSATPAFGDGLNYDPGMGPASANAQTAAVDAHYGLQSTWDFYRDVLGREGPDGTGRAPGSRVHYGEGYGNAFWSDDCFCMTYGDGFGTPAFTSLDVVAHEVTHGLCHATADLDYTGESGGLNEANSDIFAVMVSYYAKGAGGRGGVVPDSGGTWSLGAELRPEPFRHLDKPSLDGSSPDAWSEDLADRDVHHASGPMNRAFFFLSQGASPDPGSRTHSPFLPGGMKGIGNDKAIRIWWRTLSTRLTPTSGYHEALAGALASAQELYGPGSPEVAAVRSAFQGIHVTQAFLPGEGPAS
jgi:Zn-dependent metalloprotease